MPRIQIQRHLGTRLAVPGYRTGLKTDIALWTSINHASLITGSRFTAIN